MPYSAVSKDHTHQSGKSPSLSPSPIGRRPTDRDIPAKRPRKMEPSPRSIAFRKCLPAACYRCQAWPQLRRTIRSGFFPSR